MKIWMPLLTAALIISQFASAADAPPEPDKQQEVVVEATRAYLTKLGKEVQLAEARFYARYNELNKKREYAVHCYDDPHTGSRFKTNYCQPQFQSDAEAREAQEFFLMLAGSNDPHSSGTGGMANPSGPPLSRDPVIAARQPDFRKNMIEVVSKNPELQKMLKDHAELWKRYEDTYYKLHGRPLLKAKPPESVGK